MYTCRKITRSSTKVASDTFLCRICEREFQSQLHLDMHIPKHIAVCEICDHVFSNEYGFINHLLGPDPVKVYRCCLCHIECTNPLRLKYHSCQHTGKWPFTCKLCQKGFICQGLFKKHIAKHVGKAWFKCQYCGKIFLDLNKLKRHFSTFHPITGNRELNRTLMVDPAEIEEICEGLHNKEGLEVLMRRQRPVNESPFPDAHELKFFRSASKALSELEVQPKGSGTSLQFETFLSAIELGSQSKLLLDVPETEKESFFRSVPRARSETIVSGSRFSSESTIHFNRLGQPSDLTLLSRRSKPLCDLIILPNMSGSSSELMPPSGSVSSSKLSVHPSGSDSSSELNSVRSSGLGSSNKLFLANRPDTINLVTDLSNVPAPSSYKLIFPSEFQESLPELAIPKIIRSLQSRTEVANKVTRPALEQRALNKLGILRTRSETLGKSPCSVISPGKTCCKISQNRSILEGRPAPANGSLMVYNERDVLESKPEYSICGWDDLQAYLERTTPNVVQDLN